MTIDNAGRRRQRCSNASDVRLEAISFLRCQAPKIIDSVSGAFDFDGRELVDLRFGCRHKELAATVDRHLIFFGERIEPLAAFHAQLRF